MFHTFVAVEPTWNNAGGKPRLPNELEQNVYGYYTLGQLMNELGVSKASPDLVQAFKNRVGGGIRVPQDHATLEEATKWCKRFGGKTIKFIKDADDHNKSVTEVTIPRKIVVGKGEHVVAVYKGGWDKDCNTLKIDSAMNIVGDPRVPRSEIVVVGGIEFKKWIPRDCHLQHLTLRQAKGNGVRGQSSFTMEDVLVEQCSGSGVIAWPDHREGDADPHPRVVVRCTNVEVRQCGGSGVVAHSGASITLIGPKTTVHHNCTKGDSGDYGLLVYNSSSTIQLVSPLTKDHVSLDNGGGGNWGAGASGDINQIKTI